MFSLPLFAAADSELSFPSFFSFFSPSRACQIRQTRVSSNNCASGTNRSKKEASLFLGL
jgi:hypothetical protein